MGTRARRSRRLLSLSGSAAASCPVRRARPSDRRQRPHPRRPRRIDRRPHAHVGEAGALRASGCWRPWWRSGASPRAATRTPTTRPPRRRRRRAGRRCSTAPSTPPASSPWTSRPPPSGRWGSRSGCSGSARSPCCCRRRWPASAQRWSCGPRSGARSGPLPRSSQASRSRLTPVAALMFRYNNPDALLTLLLVAAAWALVRGLEDDRFRWPILAAALVGLAFLTKYLQAYLVLPAFALTYLVAARGGLRRRVTGLAAVGRDRPRLVVLVGRGRGAGARRRASVHRRQQQQLCPGPHPGLRRPGPDPRPGWRPGRRRARRWGTGRGRSRRRWRVRWRVGRAAHVQRPVGGRDQLAAPRRGGRSRHRPRGPPASAQDGCPPRRLPAVGNVGRRARRGVLAHERHRPPVLRGRDRPGGRCARRRGHRGAVAAAGADRGGRDRPGGGAGRNGLVGPAGPWTGRPTWRPAPVSAPCSWRWRRPSCWRSRRSPDDVAGGARRPRGARRGARRGAHGPRDLHGRDDGPAAGRRRSGGGPGGCRPRRRPGRRPRRRPGRWPRARSRRVPRRPRGHERRAGAVPPGEPRRRDMAGRSLVRQPGRAAPARDGGARDGDGWLHGVRSRAHARPAAGIRSRRQRPVRPPRRQGWRSRRVLRRRRAGQRRRRADRVGQLGVHPGRVPGVSATLYDCAGAG